MPTCVPITGATNVLCSHVTDVARHVWVDITKSRANVPRHTPTCVPIIDERWKMERSFEARGTRGTRCIPSSIDSLTLCFPGCGNSPLSADMYRDGFHRITNIDYSPACIRRMAHKHDNMACIRRMAHKHDNMAAMTFPDGTFEVVLEKGTLDAFMVAEISPWTVPEETAQFCLAGRFISISFAQPHFRTPLYVNDAYGWSVRTDKFGDCFHFFFYTMEHGGTLTQQQREQAHRFFHPPAVDMTPVCLSDSEEDFLRRIDISPSSSPVLKHLFSWLLPSENDLIVKVCCGTYTEVEIETSKKLLFGLCPPPDRYKKRQGANNNSSNMLDILKTLH
ncbi:EEF1A lysine methyltransferase 4-like [Branchiostoma lanceolatum]|uniref:EEF1A lysine methyltransferase 4-like n=1 Tax=Branchiostoma lanceolatum TaxID=7740 RepID=UPI003451A3E0